MAIFDVPLEVLTSRTSMKWTRYPADVLPMWVAEMDCLPSPGVTAAMQHALKVGDFGYPGYDALPRAFVAFAADMWGLELDVAQVNLCSDVVAGMTQLVERLTPPDSSIAINTPIYPPFRTVAGVGGRSVVEVPMLTSGRLDVAALEAAFATGTVAAFLLCNPHNPYGTVHTAIELAEVMRLGRQYGVRIISDEIHGPVVSPDATFVSVLQVEGAADAYVATSASKAFSLAAFKAGLLIAGTNRVDELAAFPYEVKSGSSHSGLFLQAAALESDRAWLAQLNAEIAEHKQLLYDLVTPLGLEYHPAPGTFLAWVDASPLGLVDPAATFLRTGKVAFNHGTEYGSSFATWFRVNVATSPVLITEGVRRIAVSLEK